MGKKCKNRIAVAARTRSLSNLWSKTRNTTSTRAVAPAVASMTFASSSQQEREEWTQWSSLPAKEENSHVVQNTGNSMVSANHPSPRAQQQESTSAISSKILIQTSSGSLISSAIKSNEVA